MSYLTLVVLGVCMAPLIAGELVIDDDESVKIWHHFKLKYNKRYEDPIEDVIRRQAFERNMERALVRNLADHMSSGTFQPGLNVMYHHKMDDPSFVMFEDEAAQGKYEMLGGEEPSDEKMMFQGEEIDDE